LSGETERVVRTITCCSPRWGKGIVIDGFHPEVHDTVAVEQEEPLVQVIHRKAWIEQGGLIATEKAEKKSVEEWEVSRLA
jgi:hypothetical protein